MSEDSARRPTLDTVAREVGVSRATVSNAYNRPDQLSSELRERILLVAERIGYAGPDPVARSLATQRSGAIAFMLDKGLSSAFSDPALSIVLDSLASTVDTGEWALVLMPGTGAGGPNPESVSRVHADVAVANSLADNAPALRAVRQRNLPLVVIDQPVVPGSARVEVDDAEGARLAARHIGALGHRRIGILCLDFGSDGRRGPVDPARPLESVFRVTTDRLDGYLAGLAEHGIPPESVPIWEAPDSLRELGREGAHWLLSRTDRPTALLCMSDELALGAVRAAGELGLDVPRELSVVGFDDTPAARWADPSLTTVRQDLVEKGRRAGEFVLRALEGRVPRRPTRLAVSLVERASSGPVPR